MSVIFYFFFKYGTEVLNFFTLDDQVWIRLLLFKALKFAGVELPLQVGIKVENVAFSTLVWNFRRHVQDLVGLITQQFGPSFTSRKEFFLDSLLYYFVDSCFALNVCQFFSSWNPTGFWIHFGSGVAGAQPASSSVSGQLISDDFVVGYMQPTLD